MNDSSPSISRLIHDVRSSFVALVRAEFGAFQSEMRQKLALAVVSGLWLVAAAILLLSAFALALAAVVLLMIKMGIEAHFAAAIVAAFVAACGLLALLRGLALLKRIDMTPKRTLSHLRADLALFGRSTQ